MGINVEKAILDIMEGIPEYTIPEAYVRHVVEENADFCESQDELTAESKIELCEQSGLDFMLTRSEAEEYRCEEFSDAQWEQLSTDGMVSAHTLKAIEDGETVSMYELLKTMPLIPASKMISSLVMKYLALHGVELTPEQTEALCTGVICDLNEPLGELMDPDDDDDDDEEDDDDFEFGDDDDEEDDDDFEFGDDDDDDDMEIDLEDLIREDPKIVTRRRSRITQFPGKKF
jgi:hypothetical protein